MLQCGGPGSHKDFAGFDPPGKLPSEVDKGVPWFLGAPGEYNRREQRIKYEKSWMRHKITGTVCVVCCKDFRSRTKLHNHVAYRAIRCGSYYASLADIPLELFNELEEKEYLRLKPFLAAGRSKLYHPLPTRVVPGLVSVLS